MGATDAARGVGVRRSAVARDPRAGLLEPPASAAGLHARGFEYMRLSAGLEGHISNFQRTIDGYLAGLPHERLLPAVQAVNVYPFEQPALDLGF